MASAWAGMACPALVVTDSAESWPAGSRALPGHVGSPRATAVATAHERDPVVEIHEAGAFPEGSSYDGPIPLLAFPLRFFALAGFGLGRQERSCRTTTQW
jgi:hypothetical protein